VVVEIPKGYRPVDATPAGDGRALVLLRRVIWGFPPGFATAIAEIDLAKISTQAYTAADLERAVFSFTGFAVWLFMVFQESPQTDFPVIALLYPKIVDNNPIHSKYSMQKAISS